MTKAPEPADVLWPVLKVLKEPINAYFEKVLVNAEDETLRKARLALVQQIALLPAGRWGSEQAAGVLEGKNSCEARPTRLPVGKVRGASQARKVLRQHLDQLAVGRRGARRVAPLVEMV